MPRTVKGDVMRKTGCSSAVLVAMLAAPCQAQAQDCSLSLSPTTIDFGQFNRTTLQAVSATLPLPPRRLTLRLVCETEQDLAISYQAVAAHSSGFALGDYGQYRLSLVQGTVDDQPVQWASVAGRVQAAVTTAAVGVLDDTQVLQPVRAGSVVRGRRLSAQIELEAALDTRVLALGDAQNWQTEGILAVAGQQRSLQARAGFAPAACRPTLAGQGRVDFGRIAVSRLRRDAVTSFIRKITLDIDCDAPTRLAVRALDNRAGSVSPQLGEQSASAFGIGRTAGGEPLGGFGVRLGDAVGRDGVAASVLLGDLAALNWHRDPQALLRPDGQPVAFAASSAPGSTPGAWTGLSVPLQVELYLAPSGGLDWREETFIDGSATLEILYL
jgi:hypothetical protein